MDANPSTGPTPDQVSNAIRILTSAVELLVPKNTVSPSPPPELVYGSTMPKATRAEVYQALDTERAYQARLWNPNTTSTGGQHTVSEWLLYMQDYLSEAIHTVSRGADPLASHMALHIVRKIAGMGVACMETHGAPQRAPQSAERY